MVHSSLLLFFKISLAIRSFSRLCASFTCSEDPEVCAEDCGMLGSGDGVLNWALWSNCDDPQRNQKPDLVSWNCRSLLKWTHLKPLQKNRCFAGPHLERAQNRLLPSFLKEISTVQRKTVVLRMQHRAPQHWLPPPFPAVASGSCLPGR